MKHIKINAVNAGKITMLINEVQGKSTTNLINFQKINQVIKEVENRLRFPKNRMDGISFRFSFNQKLPRAYKYEMMGTYFSCLNIKGNWYLTSICREGINKNMTEQIFIKLPEGSEDLKEKIIREKLCF